MLLEFFYCQKRMLFSEVSWKGKVKYLLFRSKHKDIQWHLYYLSKYCDFRFIFVAENFRKQNGSFAFWRHIGGVSWCQYCPVSMLNIEAAAQLCLKDKIWPIWEGNKVVQVYFLQVCLHGWLLGWAAMHSSPWCMHPIITLSILLATSCYRHRKLDSGTLVKCCKYAPCHITWSSV